MDNNTARNFVLQLGSLGSLYLSISFLLVLVFGVIDLSFPDTLDSVWEAEQAQSMIRLGIAMVIVFFPTYLILTRTVNKLRRKESSGKYLGLVKWLIYLSLLVGGLTLLVDLVVVIMAFLEGEITERFILKALAVLVAVGVAFYYYIRDAKGYWLKQEKGSIMFAGGASLIVIAAVVLGFMNIELPKEVREQKIDQAQITDLQNMQWRIQEFIVTNKAMPTERDVFVREGIYEAPEGRADYRYEERNGGFALCAEFKTTANDERDTFGMFVDKDAVVLNQNDWYYEPGDWCFERTVNIEALTPVTE